MALAHVKNANASAGHILKAFKDIGAVCLYEWYMKDMEELKNFVSTMKSKNNLITIRQIYPNDDNKATVEANKKDKRYENISPYYDTLEKTPNIEISKYKGAQIRHQLSKLYTLIFNNLNPRVTRLYSR